MNKKIKSILVILIVIACIVLVGVSYAAWNMNAKQTNTNVVSTGCFETSSDLGTSSESDAINLVDAMPMSDTDGKSLTPFTFTITNVCKTFATYQVNLEKLSTSTLDSNYLKAALDNNYPKVLTTYEETTKHLQTASDSRKLITGGLMQGESVTYDLRMWIRDDVEYSTELSNKTFASKIVVKSLELANNNGFYAYLVETSTPADGDSYELGENIQYTWNLRNIGSTNATNITIEDEASGDTYTVDTISSGSTFDFNKDIDVLEDTIINGASPIKLNVYDENDNLVYTTTHNITNIAKPRAEYNISVEETSSPSNGNYYVVGEEIKFNISITNTGNITLTNVNYHSIDKNVHMTDNLSTATSTTAEYIYTVKSTDVANSSIDFELYATASGSETGDVATGNTANYSVNVGN